MLKNVPILIHSDILRVFYLFSQKIKKLDDYPRTCLNFLEEKFDNELLFPAFNYDFGKNLIFDVLEDKIQVGILPEFIRLNTDYFRTTAPFFSVLTKRTELCLDQKVYNPFAENSIFEWLYKNKGYVMFFGAKFNAFTFIHYLETLQEDGPIYRYDKIFYGKVINRNKIMRDVKCKMHVRPINTNLQYNWDLIEQDLLKKKILKKHKFSNLIHYALIEDLVDFFFLKYKKDKCYGLNNASKILFKKITKNFKNRVRIEDFE